MQVGSHAFYHSWGQLSANGGACRQRLSVTLAGMPIPPLLQKHALNGITALLFGITVWRLGLSPELPAVLAFIFGGVLLAVIDWKVQRLPTKLVYLTLAGVAAGLLFASLVTWDWVPLATAVAGGALFAGAFYAIWFLTRRFLGLVILGFGDVRLAVVLGMVLGWYGLEYVYYGALAGHLLAVAIAVATCIHRRKLHVRYAFGHPLIAGTLAVVLFHQI
jgi:leader peptidase (prepilin peptidase)/N-methyltransferase